MFCSNVLVDILGSQRNYIYLFLHLIHTIFCRRGNIGQGMRFISDLPVHMEISRVLANQSVYTVEPLYLGIVLSANHLRDKLIITRSIGVVDLLSIPMIPWADHPHTTKLIIIWIVVLVDLIVPWADHPHATKLAVIWTIGVVDLIVLRAYHLHAIYIEGLLCLQSVQEADPQHK